MKFRFIFSIPNTPISQNDVRRDDERRQRRVEYQIQRMGQDTKAKRHERLIEMKMMRFRCTIPELNTEEM